MTNQAGPCPTCGALPCAADPIDTLDASLPSIQAGLARKVAAETQGEITQADRELAAWIFRWFNKDVQGAGDAALDGRLDKCWIVPEIAAHRRTSVAALQQENAGLIHDIERAQGHASEYLNEMEQMRERVKVMEEALTKIANGETCANNPALWARTIARSALAADDHVGYVDTLDAGEA